MISNHILQYNCICPLTYHKRKTRYLHNICYKVCRLFLQFNTSILLLTISLVYWYSLQWWPQVLQWNRIFAFLVRPLFLCTQISQCYMLSYVMLMNARAQNSKMYFLKCYCFEEVLYLLQFICITLHGFITQTIIKTFNSM